MKKVIFRCTLIAVVFIMLDQPGCKKIDEVTRLEREKGELVTLKLTNLKMIPIEFGKLTAVTASIQDEAAWAQLWFVDDSSTIRMVRVQFHNNTMHENVLVIPRN